MGKENFINKLANLSHEDINRLIQEKGKKPKVIRIFVKEDTTNNQK